MKRYFVYIFIIFSGVISVLFILIKFKDISVPSEPFIHSSVFERKGGLTKSYVAYARHSLPESEERRTVVLPDDATTSDLYNIFCQMGSNPKCVELDIVQTNNSGSIYFVNYAVGNNLVVSTVADYLSEPAYTEKEDSALKVYRIRCYEVHYVSKDGMTDHSTILEELQNLYERHIPFCVLISFEDVIPLKRMWSLLVNIYHYSDSRVYFLLPHGDGEKDGALNNEKIF